MESNPPRFTVSVGSAASPPDDPPSGDGATGAAIVHKRGVDLRSAELLRHEREVLGRIRHPGVVELAGRTDAAGPPTLSTYLAGNATLADRPPTRADVAARIGAQIATTLGELHAAGTAHGSIAPDHCVLGPSGSVVLCSLRRATTISGVDHPDARRDVADLIAMMRAWQPAPARRDRTAARLGAVLVAAERRTPAARELATALVELDSSAVASAPRTRSRRSAETAPPRERAPRSTGAAAAAWRSLGVLTVAVAAGAALWRVRLFAGPGPARAGLPHAVAATATALRWMALAACAYLAVVAVLGLAAVLTRDERLARTAERVGPGLLRRWAAGVTSIGMLGSAVASIAIDRPEAAHPSAEPQPQPPSTTSSTASTTTTTQPPTTLTAPAPTTPAPATEPATSLLATPIGPDTPTTWTVRRGDHLWSIAERSLRDRLGRDATDSEVHRYWTALVESNRARLADPSNPDLVFAGQVFLLPPL